MTVSYFLSLREEENLDNIDCDIDAFFVLGVNGNFIEESVEPKHTKFDIRKILGIYFTSSYKKVDKSFFQIPRFSESVGDKFHIVDLLYIIDNR